MNDKFDAAEIVRFHQQDNAEREIIRALRAAGVGAGDVIQVHTSMKAVFGLADFESTDDAAALLERCLLAAVGKTGTFIVPTFNYDFCEGKPYVHEDTPSHLGLFPNYILKQPQARRSFHPVFSFAGIGPHLSALFDGISKSSYGSGSVFHRMYALDAKIVFFNSTFDCCTFIHFAEQTIGVDYRHIIHFRGEVTKDGRTWQDAFDFLARDIERGVEVWLPPLSDYLLKTGTMKIEALRDEDEYFVMCVRCRDVFNAIAEKLKTDPYFMIKNPPKEAVQR